MESSSSLLLSSWFPSGRHFNPRDDELLVHLLNFVTGEPFSCKDSVSVPVVDLYGDREPWELFSQYSSSSSQTKKKKDLYFYTKLKKKNGSCKGKRISRLIGKGCWHGQDCGKKIHYKGSLLGYKKSMVYQNKNKNSNPSQDRWLLKEYSLLDSVVQKSSLILPELKDYVLCRMRLKKNKKEKQSSTVASDEQSSDDGDLSQLLSKFREKIAANLEEDDIKQQPTTGLTNDFLLGIEFDGDEEDDISNFFC